MSDEPRRMLTPWTTEVGDLICDGKVVLRIRAVVAYLRLMPKAIQLPHSVAHRFMEDLRAFVAQDSLNKRDEIAARQMSILRQYQGPRERPLRITGISEAGIGIGPMCRSPSHGRANAGNEFRCSSPYADPDAAARKIIELANAFEVIQHGRIPIEKINGPMLFELKASPAEYKAGLDRTIEKGWLTLAGADLFE